MFALPQRTDQGVVRDHIGYYAMLLHLFEYLQGLLRLFALLQRTDQGAVCDNIRFYGILLNGSEDL